jgi:ADP-ribose pyrophosphatase YjhB (NUDIX family)
MKKIPDNAKKVFEGIIFDVYHWDQEMFDGSIAVFEALKKRDTVTVVAVVDGKIIINDEEQPHKEPFISLPAGMCERESLEPLEDAKRELAEETGYISSDWIHWFTTDPIDHSKIEWKNNFYIARNCKKDAEQHLDPGEKISSRLITFEEFLELRNNAKFRHKEFTPLLQKVANDETEKQKLKDLLGIMKSNKT